MDSREMMEKIAELSKRFRKITPLLNTMTEEFYFAAVDLRNIRKLIRPLMAGVTHPNPDYYCGMGKQDPVTPYLYVLEYVVSGKGYIEVGGKKYEVCAGDTYIISRPVWPAKWYADRDDPYEKKWVNMAGRFLDGLMYAYGMTDPVYVVPLDTEKQIDEMHRILMEYNFKEPQQDNYRLMKLYLDIFERMNVALEKKNEKPDRVVFEQIVEYISTNLLYESLTPASVCLSFFISERTLTRLFAKNIGISPAKYIMLQRVEYSKQLLTNSKYSVEKIADMLFFSGARHFRQVFSRYCGMAPTEWRKRYRTESNKPV